MNERHRDSHLLYSPAWVCANSVANRHEQTLKCFRVRLVPQLSYFLGELLVRGDKLGRSLTVLEEKTSPTAGTLNLSRPYLLPRGPELDLDQTSLAQNDDMNCPISRFLRLQRVVV